MTNSQFQEAERWYTRAIEQDNTNAEALIKRAQLYEVIGRVQDSKSDVNRAMSINPYATLFLDPHFRKNQLSLRSYKTGIMTDEDLEDAFVTDLIATVDYLEMLNGDVLPPVDLSFLDLSVKAMQRGEYQQALSYLEVLEIQSSPSALSEDLHGVIDLRQGDLDAAISHFTRAIELNPQFAIAYHNRALAYEEIGASDRSREDFDRALELNAASAKTLFAKARLKEKQGDLDGARRYYNQASRLDHDLPQLHLSYSSLLKATGDYTRAMIEVTEAIETDPTVVENYFVRGGVYLIYGEYENAIEDFDRYLDAYPEDAAALFNRGLTYLLMDDEDMACRDINEGLLYGYDGPAADLALFMCP